MSDTNPYGNLVPGFDFLQSLVKNAGSALPAIGQWVAPTLNPDELEKRIEELRTVQFWLEQNARMLGATIQALEVQRMTLSTLKTMNVQMTDLRESMKIRLPEAQAEEEEEEEEVAAADESPAPPPAVEPAAKSNAKPAAAKAGAKAAAATAAPGAVDPMQWWGALTQQFTQLAASAMKDHTPDAAKAPAPAPASGTPDAAPLAGKVARKAAPKKAAKKAANKTSARRRAPAARP